MVFLELIILVLLILKLLLIFVRFLFEFVGIVRILKRLPQRDYGTFCFTFILLYVYWFWAFIIGQWLMERFILMVFKILFFVLIANLTFIFCDIIFIFVEILRCFVWFKVSLLFGRWYFFLRDLIWNFFLEIIIIHDLFTSKRLVSIRILFGWRWLFDGFWWGAITRVNCG